MKHRRNESDRAQEAMISTISTLELAPPESISKAAAQADSTIAATVTTQAQEVTPWDVAGAVVEGVQVSH